MKTEYSINFGQSDLDIVKMTQPIPVDRSNYSLLKGPYHPEFLKDELLSELFAQTVLAHPNNIAMVGDGRQLTYREVDEQALGLARGIIRMGAGPGQVVGLWMARGIDLLIAQIAIAKTGAAWLPFDADAPIDRIKICLEDAGALGLLTSPVCMAKIDRELGIPVFTPDSLIDSNDHSGVDARLLGASRQDPAYVIYTSGSTGTPKGIVVSNANICAFLRSANAVYGIRSDDIIFQSASVAFDLSMEEIWIPYLVGARLFVANPTMLSEIDKLPALLQASGVTVLDTVPTLLAMLHQDIPSLRLIIMGGEACPPTLAKVWCQPGRQLFNSYGPTEATVVATCSLVHPDEPLTIGRPIPNYSCYVVDEELRLVSVGQEGELLIGGPGVALGYLNRPELTAEKFIENPFGSSSETLDAILYRSGDSVALDANGTIVFRGRIDDQVKIRGFRVELGEIENKLLLVPGVKQAATIVRRDQDMDQIVAFLVMQQGEYFDVKSARELLRRQLPPYMVPARYEILESFPKLSSGKADRKALKALELIPIVGALEQELPQTKTQALLLSAMQQVLPPQPIDFDADFFIDLGGHSLLAARFVSIVRATPRFAGITLQDVYTSRSLHKIAEILDDKFPDSQIVRDLTFTPPPLLRRFLCGLGQALALPFILALVNAQWLSVFISYMALTEADASFFTEFSVLIAVYGATMLGSIVVAIAVKWLVLGRTKPGRYPLWGMYFFRWWLIERTFGLVHWKWFQASPLMPFLLNLFGAKIGTDCILGEITPGALDLISIGKGTTIGDKVIMCNARVEGNELIIGTIAIGDDCCIGTSCVLEENTFIGDGAELKDLTSLATGTRVPAWQIWDGSPARYVGMVDQSSLPEFAKAGRLRKVSQIFLYSFMLVFLPPLGLLPVFPAFYIMDNIDDWVGWPSLDRWTYLFSIPLWAWPASFCMIILTVLLIAACRWIILPVVREGRYSIYSWFYVRKWTVALLTEITLETLSSLYATIYMRNWYRLMGAKIGPGAEISTNLSGRYDLVEIGEKCFIADEVVLGDEDIRRGWMNLQKIQTGAMVFVGNDGVVPPGSIIPEGALIGIKSKPPANEAMSAGDTWFGSPPIKLPVRQRFDGGGSVWTYEPSFLKKFARSLFEAVHISLPMVLYITLGSWAVEIFGNGLAEGKYLRFFAQFLATSLGISLTMTAIVISVKWLTMGRYEPIVRPMWSWWAMRTEAVAVIYWGLAGRVFLDHLRGTPFLPWVLRLFGVKVGRGVYMNMTDITEFDCVNIGNFVSLNEMSALQTHLYEDRVMKVGRVCVADGVTIGAGSTVLYDTHINEFAHLGPLTLVMKGETIPSHSCWIGAPAEPSTEASKPGTVASSPILATVV